MSVPGPSSPRILSYQRERTLDRVPGYRVGMQLKLASDGPVYLAVSSTEFALYFDQPDVGIHYDLEGRLLRMSEPGQYRRLSLSHRLLLTRKLTREEGGGVARMVLPIEDANALVADATALVKRVRDGLAAGTASVEFAKPSLAEARERIEPLLARAAAFDGTAAARSAEQFRQVYGRVAVLPPDQYNALVLQATEGCAYAGCLFCELYSHVLYRRKTPALFREHLERALAFHGEGLRARRSIFLGEANALLMPQADLVEIFRILNERLELPPADQFNTPASWWMGHATQFDGVCSFLDVFKRPQHSADDFRELRQLGLRRVYIGMESGDDALLRWLRKPASAESITTAVHALKESGVAVGLIVLLGAGGRRFAASHVRETARVLNELPLDRHDYIYFSPLVIHPGGKYAARTLAQGGECLSDAQMHEQEMAIRAALQFDHGRRRPYLAHYELETFVY